MSGKFRIKVNLKPNRPDLVAMRAQVIAVALIAMCLPLAALAQQAGAPANPPIKRTPLQTFDVPGTQYQTVIGLAEVVPNVNIGRHTHPGPESGYMLEVDFVLLVEGQPDKPVKAGESYQVWSLLAICENPFLSRHRRAGPAYIMLGAG